MHSVSTMSRPTAGRAAIAALLLCGAGMFAASPAFAQTYQQLTAFDGANGSQPVAPVVQGPDGNFYGTTKSGGANMQYGTVFKMTPRGGVTVLYSFCSLTNCADGEIPVSGLTLGPDGNFYGTTSFGGNPTGKGGFPNGTVFRISPQGAFTTLYSFCNDGQCTDGAVPDAGLMLGSDGNFYGTTSAGGTHKGNANGGGTIFAITPQGALTTIYNFCTLTNCADGDLPEAGLVQATNGKLYGTTYAGGANDDCDPFLGCGTVFEFTGSKLKTLYSFCARAACADGQEPQSALVQYKGGFYGATPGGGTDIAGTIFSITSKGQLTTLVGSGLFYPNGLILGTDGNFYGTEVNDGAGNSGAVFQMTPHGALTTEYSFCNCNNDGEGPAAPLFQATSGSFYGTTAGGEGTSSDGTVFELTAGVAAFVETVPTSGAVGQNVIILGAHLLDTTNVSFNGTPAGFTAISDTELSTTVPAGASTGSVKVTTANPHNVYKSNAKFRVLP